MSSPYPSPVPPALSRLNTLLAELTQERPLPEILGAVAKGLTEILDGDHATVTLLDDRRQFFRIECEFPQSDPSLVGEKIRVIDRPAQENLLKEKQPVVVHQLGSHPIFKDGRLRDTAERLGIQSMIIVPLILNQSTEGTISLDSTRPDRKFTEADVMACQSIAHVTAVALARSRLLDEQEKYRRQAGAGLPLSRVQKVSQELLDRLHGQIAFEKGSVQLVMEGKRTLTAAYGFDKETADPYLLRPIDDDPLIARLVKQQSPLVISDTASHSEWNRGAATENVNSWLGVPLIFRGRTIGLVTLDHATSGFYGNLTTKQGSQIREICGHLAADIHSAYDLDAAQRHFHQVIGHVGEKIAATLKLDELLPQLATAISTGLECSRTVFFLMDRKGERRCLEIKAEYPDLENRPKAIEVDSCVYPGRPSPIQQAFLKNETILIEDVRQDESYDLSDSLFFSAGSVVVVPLRIANQAVGVVTAMHQKPNWFSPAEALLLETLAHHSDIAIERGTGLDLVHSVGADTLRLASMQEVLKRIVSAAIDLTRTDSGVIYVLNDEQDQIEHAVAKEGYVHPKPRLDNPHGITRAVIRDARLVAIPDITKDPLVNPDLLGEYRSMFAVPLALKGKVVGVLYLNGRTTKVLTETEKSLLYTLGDQAANFVLRTRLDERLAASEAMYHSLLDNIPQCIFRKDENSRFVSANEAFRKSLDRRWEDIRGKSDYDLYDAEVAGGYVKDDQTVMWTKEPLHKDEPHWIKGADKPIWVHVVKTPVFDASGNVTGVQAIFWDVTEQREAEEKRREAEQRWRSLVEQSPDSIVVHSGGEIRLANPAAMTLFGIESMEELSGRHITEFIEPSFHEAVASRLDRLIKGEAVEQGAGMKVLKKNRETVDVEVYASAGPGKNEVQVVIHDLTGKQVLLKEMHHRVRRSLNNIQGLLSYHEGFTNDSRVTRAFEAVRRQIQAMALVHTILKDTARESDVQMRNYLTELVGAVAAAYLSPTTAVEHVIDVKDDFTLDEKRATACGLIVTELVSNSLLHGFREESGRVSVAMQKRGNRITLTVSDNGIGISSARKKNHDSMGLTLVAALVEDDLNGVPKVSGKNGTRWLITFPSVV